MTSDEYFLTLLDGPPWGFRIFGGKDQDYPPYVSQVRLSAASSFTHAKPLFVAKFKLDDFRNNGPNAVTLPSPLTNGNENESNPILKQPNHVDRLQQQKQPKDQIHLRNRTDSIESDITGLAKKAYDAFEAKVTRSAMSSQENLVFKTANWNFRESKKPLRKWAPVKFHPLSSGKASDGFRAQSQSAPTTPTPGDYWTSEPLDKPNPPIVAPKPVVPKLELYIERPANVSVAQSRPLAPYRPVVSNVPGLQKSASLRCSIMRPQAVLAPVFENLLSGPSRWTSSCKSSSSGSSSSALSYNEKSVNNNFSVRDYNSSVQTKLPDIAQSRRTFSVESSNGKHNHNIYLPHSEPKQLESAEVQIVVSNDFDMPPPPPPPPPPPSSTSGRPLHAKVQNIPVAVNQAKTNDTLLRSTIDYPNPQSFPPLRNTGEVRKGISSNGAPGFNANEKHESYSQYSRQPLTIVNPHNLPNGGGDEYLVSRRENRSFYQKTSAYNVSGSFDQKSPPEILEDLKVPYQTWKGDDYAKAHPPPPPLSSARYSPAPPPRPRTPLEYRYSATNATYASGKTARPDNFARPYQSSSFRDGTKVVTRNNYYAPQKSNATSRFDSSGDVGLLKVKTSYDSDDITSQGRQNFDSREHQHDWYKRMYKKMHIADLPSDKTVYRYRVNDYVGDRYLNKTPTTDLREGASQERVSYKFSEYLSEPESEPAKKINYPNQSLYTSAERSSRKTERENFVRSPRSKSADKFDSILSTTPSSTLFPSYERQGALKSDNYKATFGEFNLQNRNSIISSKANYLDRLKSNYSGCKKSSNRSVRKMFNVLANARENVEMEFMKMDQNKYSSSSYKEPSSGIYSADSTNLKRDSYFTDNRSSSTYNKNTSRQTAPATTFKQRKNSLPFELEELTRLEKELALAQEDLLRQENVYGSSKVGERPYYTSNVKKPVVYSGGGTVDRMDSASFKSGPISPGGDLRGVARALYSYDARAPNELSFFKGDLIKIRRTVDEYWYEGEVRGQAGYVPSNHVEIAAAASGDERVAVTEVASKSYGKGLALFNFDGRKFNELPLQKGEYVSLIRKIDDMWYEGKNDTGRIGMFPANYVRVISEPSSTLTDYVEKIDADEQSNLKSSGYMSSHGHSASAERRLGSAPTDLSKAERFKAIYDYKPRHPDELELKENDEIFVTEKCDDNWYIGSSARTGKLGTFPGNYVKKL